jgi:hypothetical protein
MSDPVTGRSRAERALGTPGVSTQKPSSEKAVRSRVNEFRNVHIGMFDGPRPSYGRYNVSEQASDILNRSLNRRGTK